MAPTLFHIPNQIAGFPVFGAGLLLIVWVAFSVLLMIWLIRRQGFSGDTWSNLPLLILIGAAIWLLLPRLTDSQGLPIRGYGVMVLLAMVFGTGLAVWRGRRVGFSSDAILSLVFWMFVPGVIGARLFYVVEYWPAFQRATRYDTFVQMINITEGGLVIYGAMVGGFLGLVAYIVKYRLPALATLDLLAPPLMLGLALGRIGCLMNGCCFGGVCDLPWAIHFPPGSPAQVHEAQHGDMFLHGLKVLGAPASPPVITAVEPGSPAEQHGLKADQTITSINGLPIHSVAAAQEVLLSLDRPGMQLTVATAGSASEATWTTKALSGSLAVHPTQIYSSINALLICLLLLAWDPFRRRDGTLFALLLTIYPITRFLLEMIRTDEAPVFGTGMSISQNVSLLLLLAAVALWAYILRRPAHRTSCLIPHTEPSPHST